MIPEFLLREWRALLSLPQWKPGVKRSDPFTGKVKIGPHSSLRKLARAMRRGMVPDDRQVIIDTAMQRAAQRRK